MLSELKDRFLQIQEADLVFHPLACVTWNYFTFLSLSYWICKMRITLPASNLQKQIGCVRIIVTTDLPHDSLNEFTTYIKSMAQ